MFERMKLWKVLMSHTHRGDADGKLVVENVLLNCVVVGMVGVEPNGAVVIQIFVKVNVAVHQCHLI